MFTFMIYLLHEPVNCTACISLAIKVAGDIDEECEKFYKSYKLFI